MFSAYTIHNINTNIKKIKEIRGKHEVVGRRVAYFKMTTHRDKKQTNKQQNTIFQYVKVMLTFLSFKSITLLWHTAVRNNE